MFKIVLVYSLVGIAFAQTTKATREASHALHALFTQAMGQCQKLKSRIEIVGNRKEDWKCKKLL
jgi:hypothetical protein